MKRHANTENYKALHAQLLEDTAKLIGHPVDALVTRFVALARLKMQTIEMQLIAGNPNAATAAEIDTLRQQLEPYMPKAQANLRVTFVGARDEAPAGGPSVSGVVACRRCGWTPPAKDVVEKCYACSWFVGCDDLHTPHRPLLEPPPAPAPKAPPSIAAALGGTQMHRPRPQNVASSEQPSQHPDDVEEDKRRARLAELRQPARATDGYEPPPQEPRISYNNDGGSCSDLMRRINNSYV